MTVDELFNHMKKATLDERARCARIVQAARHGEIDSDLRSVIHRIERGDPFPEPEDER